MTVILNYGIMLLLLFGCQANDLFLQKSAAARFLSRFRRANSFIEERKQGNLERECMEESCNKEEVREIFEDVTKTELFWDFYTGGTTCNQSPCKNNAACDDGYGEISCNCLGGFSGMLCETDINECELLHPCPPGSTCVDGINKFTCNCPVDGCIAATLTSSSRSLNNRTSMKSTDELGFNENKTFVS